MALFWVIPSWHLNSITLIRHPHQHRLGGSITIRGHIKAWALHITRPIERHKFRDPPEDVYVHYFLQTESVRVCESVIVCACFYIHRKSLRGSLLFAVALSLMKRSIPLSLLCTANMKPAEAFHHCGVTRQQAEPPTTQNNINTKKVIYKGFVSPHIHKEVAFEWSDFGPSYLSVHAYVAKFCSNKIPIYIFTLMH